MAFHGVLGAVVDRHHALQLVVEHPLDDVRRANVVELLRRLQDRFAQVVVITHIDAVRDGLDRIIEVRYDETRGCSTVAGADGELLDAGDAPLPLAGGA